MRLEWNTLSPHQKVWYQYPRTGIYGPFVVVAVRGQHDGRHVLLRELSNHEERDVNVDDDEDFGAPIFYDNAEGK